MRFSVVIPVYNAADYIEECAASLLGQRGFSDFELIFVDDGSTDGSAGLLDRLKTDPRVRVFHTENRGSVSARKTGIDAAGGEYVLFCDADDRFRPDCMRTVDGILGRTGAGLLVWNFARFRNGEVPVPAVPVFADGAVFEGSGKERFCRELLASSRLNTIWNKAFRRELLTSDPTDFSFYADNPMSDDLLVTLWPVTKAERIVYSTALLYDYRTTPGGLTQTFDKKRAARARDTRVREKLLSYLPEWGMDTPGYRALFAKRCLNDRIDVAMSAFRRAKGAEAEKAVLAEDWFSGLPVTEEQEKKAVRSLALKQRAQYVLIRTGRRRLLGCLAGKAKR